MKLVLDVITPTKTLLKEEVDQITLSTIEGEITILPNHANLMTKLAPGEMVVKNNGKTESYAVFGGFLEISDNKVNILADHAVRAVDLEIAKVMEAKERAEKAMKDKTNDQDFQVADAELRRALMELKVVRKHKPLKS
jgi:F-type H+-transporting ATPase subunit epsilon